MCKTLLPGAKKQLTNYPPGSRGGKSCFFWHLAGSKGTQIMLGACCKGDGGLGMRCAGFGFSWSKALHFLAALGPSVDAQGSVSIRGCGEHPRVGGIRCHYPGSIIFILGRTWLLFLSPCIGNFESIPKLQSILS